MFCSVFRLEQLIKYSKNMCVCVCVCGGLPGSSVGKESACNTGDTGSISGLIPWRKARQLTPVFLSGEFHGQRSLAGYSPWGYREPDMTEATE